MTPKTPKGMRLHIGLFGRRNVGKSSLLNAITRQQVSIVSAFAGTTTDPVEKPMELLPLGPVLFIDTAGIDDAGAVGDLRVARTRAVFERTDLGIVVTDGTWGDYEQAIVAALAVLGPSGAFDARGSRVREELLAAAASVSAKLGHVVRSARSADRQVLRKGKTA